MSPRVGYVKVEQHWEKDRNAVCSEPSFWCFASFFEKSTILEGFSNFSDEFTDAETCIQLNLFDF